MDSIRFSVTDGVYDKFSINIVDVIAQSDGSDMLHAEVLNPDGIVVHYLGYHIYYAHDDTGENAHKYKKCAKTPCIICQKGLIKFLNTVPIINIKALNAPKVL
jgi:hypothetical protein